MKRLQTFEAQFVLFFVLLALAITVIVTNEWRSGGREEQPGLVFAPSSVDATALNFKKELLQAYKDAREKKPVEVSADLSKVVEKYITPGMTFTSAVDLMRRAEFHVHVETYARAGARYPVTGNPTQGDHAVGVFQLSNWRGGNSLAIDLIPEAPNKFDFVKKVSAQFISSAI